MTSEHERFLARGDTRKFPIQADDLGAHGEISWRLAEKAFEAYQAAGHRSQSLERLAERGGFGWWELMTLLRGPQHYCAHVCDSSCWSNLSASA